MELLTGDIFDELRKAFIQQLTDEDFVVDFIVGVGNNPEKYSDILDPMVTRIALAYKGAMDSFMELDELAALEHLAKQVEKPAEPETVPDNPQGHQKILEFPVDLFFEESDDE
tara:strand:+ start:331 stop:669 length:339 start_codon:yes stop_codon:yes gene_type:complete